MRTRTLRALSGLLFTSVLAAAPIRSSLFLFYERNAAIHDGQTLARLGTVDAGPGLTQAVAVAGGGAYLIGPDRVVVLDSDLTPTGEIELHAPVGEGPSPAASILNGAAVLVAAGEKVYWINTETGAIEFVLDPGFSPSGVLAFPGAARAYVFSAHDRRVMLLDLDQRTVLPESLWLPAPPSRWIAAPDGSTFAVVGDGVFRLETLIPASISGSAPPNDSTSPLRGMAPFAAGRLAALFSDGSLATSLAGPRSATLIESSPSGDALFVVEQASSHLVRLEEGEAPVEVALLGAPRSISAVGPTVEQSATGSLVQQFGNNQVVMAGESFSIGVRALTSRQVPMVGVSVAVSTVLPAGNAVVCQPGVTDTGGIAVVNCAVSGVGEDVELSITVSDALGRDAPPFTVRVRAVPVGDGLQSLSGLVVTTPRNNVFQFVVQASASGRLQPGLDLTVTADPAFPLISCPSLLTTDVNGQANVLCRAGGVTTPTTSAVSVVDPFGRRVDVTVVVVPHVTLGDGPHKAGGDGQTVTRFGVLATPLLVSALDGGLPREKIELDVSTNSPILFCPSKVFTDIHGQARIICSAGSTEARHFAKVFATDPEGRGLASPFTVTIVPVNPGSADALTLLSEEELEGPVGVAIPDAIRVLATDGGSEAPGSPVFFTATGEALFEPSIDVSDQRGEASATLTPGCPARPEIIGIGLSGSASDLMVKLKVLPGPPRIISKIRGDLQEGAVGELLNRDALVVQITDICGSPLVGLPVDWSVEPSSAAALENTIAITDGNGRSSTLVRLGDRAGRFQVTARSGDLAVVFTLAVTQIPTAVEPTQGDAQRVRRGEEAPLPLTVRVRDQDGGPIENIRVRFAVTAGVATVSDAFVRTDANGEASTRVTAGDQTGRVNVLAEVMPETAAALSLGAVPQSSLFHIFTLDVIGGDPAATTNAFVNGASFVVGWTPGSIGTVFGRDLAGELTGPVVAGPAPFPTTLQGVSLSVNGVAAPIVGLARSGGQDQINVQVPFGLAAGPANVVINNNGAESTISGVPINPVQPGVFQFRDGQSFLAAALHVDFSPVTRLRPAAPNEPILLFVTGLGPVEPAVETNVAGPSSPATTVSDVVVGLDGEGMPVLGAFYAPGLVGTYQINFIVASSVRPGDRQLSVVVEGVASQDVILPVGLGFDVDPL